MKKFITTISALLFILASANAECMKCEDGKCGGSMKSAKSVMAMHKIDKVDGYELTIASKKPLVVGNNTLNIAIFKDGKKVDAKVKVKFFMPEMPGMPYMESKDKGKTEDGSYDAKINLSMGGTWQYQIKFKTADDKVHKLKGSINL